MGEEGEAVGSTTTAFFMRGRLKNGVQMHLLHCYNNDERKDTMTRTYKKSAIRPQPRDVWPCRHTNHRGLRKRMDRIDRRRLNRFTVD